MSRERFKVYSKYVGVPYVDRGRDISGWDCYGLYAYVLAEVMGKQVPSYAGTYATADDASQALEQRGEWSRVTDEPREGDGVVFLLRGVPMHCGYVITPGYMLHALKGRDTAIERYDTMAWNKRIEGFYRWN